MSPNTSSTGPESRVGKNLGEQRLLGGHSAVTLGRQIPQVLSDNHADIHLSRIGNLPESIDAHEFRPHARHYGPHCVPAIRAQAKRALLIEKLGSRNELSLSPGAQVNQ